MREWWRNMIYTSSKISCRYIIFWATSVWPVVPVRPPLKKRFDCEQTGCEWMHNETDERALTVWTLRRGNLLYMCPVSTGKNLHLTLVPVELSIRSTNRLPLVAAVPIACAALKLLLLRAAKHVVAPVCLYQTCRKRYCIFRRSTKLRHLQIETVVQQLHKKFF